MKELLGQAVITEPYFSTTYSCHSEERSKACSFATGQALSLPQGSLMP